MYVFVAWWGWVGGMGMIVERIGFGLYPSCRSMGSV